MAGFQYNVHPWAFVVHMPHKTQHRRDQQLSSDNEKHMMMQKLFFNKIPARMREGTYHPVVAQQSFEISPRIVYNTNE
jgi:hypothetical protein